MTSIYQFTERVPVIIHVKRYFGVELVRGFQKKSVTRKMHKSENKEQLETERERKREREREREREKRSRRLSRLLGSLTWGRYFIVKRL